jgi:protein-disulfide isomerase
VDQSVRAGVADGAQGTPHILINDEVFGGNAANYDAIRAAVNAALVAVE